MNIGPLSNTRSVLALVLLLALGAGCASPEPDPEPEPEPDITVMDFRNARGAYALGYTSDLGVRTMFEDQLVTDLAARDMRAWPSYPDLPDVTAMSRDGVLAAARDKKAMFIVVAEAVAPGDTGVVPEDGRITHDHPDLQDFYEHSKSLVQDYDPDRTVLVEVSAFLIEDDGARLVWSGTTWSFGADGQGGAIPDISATIADAIAQARDRFLED